MFEPEEEAGEVREENSGEPISEPVSETEPEAINDTQSEAQPEAQSEPEAAAPEAEAGSAQSDEAQKLREEYPEQVYADARYEPEGESTVPPRYYCPPERPAKEAREKKSGRSHVFLKAACLALACALLGGLAGASLTANSLKGRIDAMETAFARGNYSHHIDVMSFIDYQLMMELCHNVDAYRLSGKFYKRRDSVDPRFKMVVWDTDRAYGNVDYRQSWRTDTWMYRNNDIMYQEEEVYLIPFWWYVLNNDPAYTAQVKMRWAQYREGNLRTDRLMATLDSLAAVVTVQGAEGRNSHGHPCGGQKNRVSSHGPLRRRPPGRGQARALHCR